MSNQTKILIENEALESEQAKAVVGQVPAFDDLSDEELEARISKGGRGC